MRVPSDGAWTSYVLDELPGRGCDGVVFVGDASPQAIEANVASLASLSVELAARGFDLAKLPSVLHGWRSWSCSSCAADPRRRSENLRRRSPLCNLRGRVLPWRSSSCAA